MLVELGCRLRYSSRGYLLPITIALGLGISTVNVLGMQIVAQNSATLNTQYYNAVAKEAAQAGTIAAANCIRADDTDWSDDNNNATILTPATDCNGTAVNGRSTTLANDANLSSTYEVGTLQTVGANSSVVTSIGKVFVKGPSGVIVKTYKQSVRTLAKTSVTVSGATSRAVDQVSTGTTSTCSVAEAWVYCWGDNANGELGIGASSVNSLEAYPSAVASNTSTIPAYAGVSHQECSSWLFGFCTGYSTVWDRLPVPAQPASALVGAGGVKRTVTKVSVGTNHTCAVADGKAYCWGDNTYGQLGNRNKTSSWVPVAVDASASYTPPPVAPSPCGGFFQPSCTPVAQPTQPASALYNKTVVDITAGANFTCAETSDGNVSC